MCQNYIEFRVGLNDDADVEESVSVGEALRDHLIDAVSDESASEVFNKQVVYEVWFNKAKVSDGVFWTIYKSGTSTIKAQFSSENEAKEYHRINGGDLACSV